MCLSLLKFCLHNCCVTSVYTFWEIALSFFVGAVIDLKTLTELCLLLCCARLSTGMHIAHLYILETVRMVI